MTAAIIAPADRDQARLFPEISRALYEATARAAPLGDGAEALRKAHERLSRKQRRLGIGLDDAARMTLLLSLHREAFAEELQGRAKRADFRGKGHPEDIYRGAQRCAGAGTAGRSPDDPNHGMSDRPADGLLSARVVSSRRKTQGE